ncbi:hypothetical protein [Campylobacter sp. CCS1377]|uniref:Prepilin-type N-terminal cleavage/methylation domain-containing protein n=1 Tax=Campylobacter sp. CCS1377 TaxID=3158229 RepID=A0AAU7E6A5_9BACT|nr:hypothetical protein [Campylobacter jejuni]
MKTAFSLFESIIVISLLGILFLILANPIKNLYSYQLVSQKQAELVTNVNSTFIILDKFLQRCIKFQKEGLGYTCYLKDDDNLLQNISNKISIGSSSIFLQDENSEFYSPNSQFLDIMQNHRDLLGKNDNKLLFYDLLQKQFYNTSIISQDKISHNFIQFPMRFYLIIQSKITFFMKDNSLFIKFNNGKNILLMQNISNFEITQQNNILKSKICILNTPISCFEKWSLL